MKEGIRFISFRFLIGCIIFLCCTNPAESDLKLVPSVQGIYHGAQPGFGNTEDIVTTESIDEFESLAGKEIAWAYFSQNWSNGLKFPSESVQIITNAGSVPFIRLMPWHGERYEPETEFSLEAIIQGDFDSELAAWANAARSYGGPILLDFGVEMNGDWFPWNGLYHGAGQTDGYGDPLRYDGPERFRDAYRHIYEVFMSENADNITWFFHANNDSFPDETWNAIEEYYPGDDVVDWMGVSVYGALLHTDEWLEFIPVMDDAYAKIISLANGQPIALQEWGVLEDAELGDKAQWITDALRSFAQNRYPQIKAISYWNEIWENETGDFSDLRINSSPEALAAYHSGISNDIFLSDIETGDDEFTRVDIRMPLDYFYPGAICSCTATVHNHESGSLSGYPLFVILDVHGSLFFAPSFSQTMDSYLNDHPDFPTGKTQISVIEEFEWPDVSSTETDIFFYAALTDPQATQIIGNYGVFEFGWGN